MKKYILIICLIWTALTAASLFWNYKSAVEEQKKIALQGARSNFQQIVLFRSWNARHGGVYVKISPTTQPNPYLEIENRDIFVTKKLALTMVNPASMTREVSEVDSPKNGIKFHITSLKPIRPQNRATPLEEEALKEFEQGLPEKGRFISVKTGNFFFYMAPLITDSSCLDCHRKQGYREGDIRGGISITLPFTPRIPIFALISGHLLILATGLGGIILSGVKLSTAYSVIRRQAVFDALTGIPNRHSFSERILTEFKRSLRDSYSLSVIMADIDNFKLFNDTYGHGKGDECLKNVAKAIESTLKRPGDFCARYGGEEFIIILPATDSAGALALAGEIITNVQNLDIPHEKSLTGGTVTISLGIATKQTGENISHEGLLKMADDALYTAKKNGRNRAEVYVTKT